MSGWFAEDPEQARAERFVLAQTPLWIAAVAIVMLTDVLPSWGDAQLLAFSCAVAAPAVVGSLWASRSYGLKLNVWVAIVVVFGTYIGTAYFFDLMGMRYAFGTSLSLQSPVVGRNGGEVPLFMYPLTHAYFMSYYVGLVVAWRGICNKLNLGTAGRVAVLFILAYGLAFAETFFMAGGAIDALFGYADRARMLALGSFGYAPYFLIGVPFAARIRKEQTLSRVVMEALAVCMMILAALEAWAQVVGPL